MTQPTPGGGGCDTPALGCECETEGEAVECGQVERVSGDYVSCSMGERTCTDGKWGACIGDSIATLHAPASQRTLALGSGMNCPDNPCDPYCRVATDSPAGLPLPDGGAFTANGGLQVVPHQEAGGMGTCTSITVKPTPQSVTVTGIASSGLLGEYFNQIDAGASQIPASWTPFFKRTDASINFNWDTDPRPAGLAGSFSIRWTGSLIVPTTEAYTFCTESDDGSRLWIDGTVVVNGAWYDHGAMEICSSPLNLIAGSAHSIRYEYYQSNGNASSRLRWKTPSITDQVVPASAFVVAGTTIPILSATPKFDIDVNPPGCFPGTPMPAWTLDRFDIATIDSTGKVALTGAVAAQIKVTAFLGTLSATGLLNVATNISDTAGAPTGSSAAFMGTQDPTADPAKVLYPYDQTVLPIGLRPPRIQWSTGGTAASAVKIGLAYNGTTAFSWSEIIAESNPPQADIPPYIWKFFEQTAKGQTAQLTLQRIVGGKPRPAISRSVVFSNAPVRGKIYYTQYNRAGATNANQMVANPGSDAPAQPAFSSADGCPVCHSMSANGTVFATSSNVGRENGVDKTYSGSLGGISSVNTATGKLTPLVDFPTTSRSTYYADATDWRGFAWSALTPTGSYGLVANNIWGNTFENVIGIDGDRKVNTGSAMQSGGAGTGLLAKYYPSGDFTGAVWKRIDPQVNFNIANSPGGLIGADFSVRRTGRIQAYFNEPYKFEVVSSSGDKFTLNVAGTSSGTLVAAPTLNNVAMTAGALVDIQLDQVNATGNSNVQLFWSSPSTPRALVPQSQLFPPAAEPVHGANVVYKDDASGTTVSLIEPDIASNWGDHNPAAGVLPNNWTSTWDASVESPYSGSVQLCVDAANLVALKLDGATQTTTVTADGSCAPAQTWVLGEMHTVNIAHHDVNSNPAYLFLKFKYSSVTEVVPSANLYPVTAPPTNGLTATYYDTETFNVGLGQAESNPRAFQRVDPNIDFDWGSGRPNYSIISDDENYSARWTGQIVLPCDGMYQFQTNGNVDDGGRLWIDNSRVMGRWNYGPLSGAIYLPSGTHDFKFDWHETGGNAVARLQWDTPCAADPAGFVTIPSSAFKPNPNYSRTAGFVIDGGDNGNNTNYWVWQMPTSASPVVTDQTALSPGNWGLAGSSLMVPAFSPNGQKLVFVDGDSADGAGWRKGLSTFDFDEANKVFKNRHLVTSTWPQGDVIKWPTFESDSRSVIYQTTIPGDTCCRKSTAPLWKTYGFMGPTNYYEDPGRLWSIDTQAATPTPVELVKLNKGEQAKDNNKSYQATMLPVAAGGYRWAVFTSTRPYGNSANLPGIQTDFSNTSNFTWQSNYSAIQSQLWVAAIDDTPSAGADRSHPAFWLPSQNFAADASTGYVNERAYWVLDSCHAVGSSAASTCEVDEDCCGGTATPKTAACRIDAPVTNPPTRHCRALPAANGCVTVNNSCGGGDCCTGLACIGAVCVAPPSVTVFGNENYERIYQSDCPEGTKVIWRFFDRKTVTPATDSKLEFYAETQADPTLFSTLPKAPVPVTTTGPVVAVGSASGAPITTWTGNSVDLALSHESLKSQMYLKITIRFITNTEHTASPVLTDWRQSYSCVPAE